MPWTPYAKRLRARLMYERGKGFILASALLNRVPGHDMAGAHLFCQGLEILMKGLLLAKDHDAYAPQLRPLGHRLLAIVDRVVAEFGVRPLAPDLRSELAALSQRYERHELRYAGLFELLVGSELRVSDRLVRRVIAVGRLADRTFASLDSSG